ncbi:MAG: DNA polymerase IV [Gaiellales bacterium]
MSRVVAHLDLDAFFAAVEVLENPALAGVPLVVGGDPHGRGVVSTASYEARVFGIRSAMSSAEAYRRCPTATFVRPEMAKYKRHSEGLWALVRGAVPVVEQVGIDEGYLDLGDVVSTAGEARRFLARLQRRIRAETGLGASFGCGTGKTVAKIASDADKPVGLVVVAAGREEEFLAPRPLRALPGIGPKAEQRLQVAGLERIGQLADLDDEDLRLILPGALGRDLRERARGIDPRPVVAASGPSVTIGNEETFDHDIADPALLSEHIARLAAGATERMAKEGLVARTVTVKLRYPDFRILSRAKSAAQPTAEPAEIARLAELALQRALRDRPPPIRLLGVSLSRLVEGEQLHLPLDEDA